MKGIERNHPSFLWNGRKQRTQQVVGKHYPVGERAMAPKKAAKPSRNEQYESPHSSNQSLDSAFSPEFRNEL